jgi:DNA (cytosine-5)-methyltransferase 1
MITHYDLFAGIGGFSLALEEVFDEPIRHIFCEWESFPTAVLRQHWPDGEFWGDIAELVANTNSQRLQGQNERKSRGKSGSGEHFTIVTGGFPCQPFSHAGRRKGTADDRYQWPNMFAVIRNTKPEWVIAENVRGLVTWSEGLVLETVCADLESEGYEVQPLIIPAVAVGAPHRRDRVWIIGHRTDTNSQRVSDGFGEVQKAYGEVPQRNDHAEPINTSGRTHADPRRERRSKGVGESVRPESQESERPNRQYPDWSRNWQEVAFATCDDSMDDGLSRLVDGVSYSRAKWRKDSLKAYGNGIVSQVAMEIMIGIKTATRIEK